MTEITIRPRKEIPGEYIWNAASVFETRQAWQQELEITSKRLSEIEEFKGRLEESPSVLLHALQLSDELFNLVGKLKIYAEISHHVDTTDQEASGMVGKALALNGQAQAALAIIKPELLAFDEKTLRRWIDQEPGLKTYAHFFDDLLRKQAHIRTAEVEELLGSLADPFESTRTTTDLLINADFKIPPARDEEGKDMPVTEGTIDLLLADHDRKARRTAWENYSDTYLAFKNTLANNLATSIKQNVLKMRARRHRSSLEASLFENNIPPAVFYNLIEAFKKNLPVWHRYWAIRRQALGVDTLHTYDIWAPLAKLTPTLTYEQSVDIICRGLAPLGEEYVEIMRAGCLQERWVDVYPNLGKSSGAFSYGWQGTYPFIMMSYDDTIFSLGTLAHELGHSMHSCLTWEAQPPVYSQYSLFAAEVASNFHQAMVRAYMLENIPDEDFQISVMGEAMANFHRYLFIMPTLARFELETHQRVERGQGLTADELNELMVDLFSEGYGGQMFIDRPRVGITWATFAHLYSDYYVYQYATGISAANALASRILSGEPGSVEAYLTFLKSGSSRYPLDALKLAGVDLTTPGPVDEAFRVLSEMVDRLEKLAVRTSAERSG